MDKVHINTDELQDVIDIGEEKGAATHMQGHKGGAGGPSRNENQLQKHDNIKAGEVALRLQERNYVNKVIRTLASALKATRDFKDKDGNIHSSPDWNSRIRAVEVSLSYIEGLPIKRQQILHSKVETPAEIKKKVKRSPKLRAALREMLDEMDND